MLLVGESDVGKTHYGAQLLGRLMGGDGLLRMDGAATNLEPYAAALKALNEGRPADHTPTATYVDSVWPIVDRDGRRGELVWPDYGGEQVRGMTATRRVPSAWRSRVLASSAWVLLVRLHQASAAEDVFSRPLDALRAAPREDRETRTSDQARLVELVQFLLHVERSRPHGGSGEPPGLCVLLTCWDELGSDAAPPAVLATRMPMFADFLRAHWGDPTVMGLSALGRALDPHARDMDYVVEGPERFGYVVDRDGSRTTDLTTPIATILERTASG